MSADADAGAVATGSVGEDPRADLAFGSIPGLVAAAAARFGDAEALVDGDVRWSFLDLEEHALRVTRASVAAGIEPGDRVAIWAPNIAEWVAVALGLLGADAARLTRPDQGRPGLGPAQGRTVLRL